MELEKENKIHKRVEFTDFISIKTDGRIKNIPSDYALLCVDGLRKGFKVFDKRNTSKINKALSFIHRRLEESKVFFITDRRMLVPNGKSLFCYVDIDVMGRFNAINSTKVKIKNGLISWSISVMGETISTRPIDIYKLSMAILGDGCTKKKHKTTV